MTDKVPTNNDEFATLYGRYVAEQVERRILFRKQAVLADVLQSVWLRLIESNLVVRYHERVKKSRPVALTTEEVCQHLGISFESWATMQAAYQAGSPHLDWMPSPLAGEATSLDALWGVDDVERYEGLAGQHHNVGTPNPLIPQPKASEFRTYLQKSINNAYANWIRSNHRHNRDRPIDLYVTVPFETEGDFDLFDKVMDVDSPAVRCEAQVASREAIQAMQLGEHEDNFLALLCDGYTAVEAARKLKFTKPQIYRIASVIQG